MEKKECGNSSLLGVPKNEWDNPSEIGEESGVTDRDMSFAFAIAARLSTQHHNIDAYKQDEDLENGMEHQVESQLKRPAPTLVVGEVRPPIRTTTCKQCCSRWKSILLLILLCVCGTIVRVIMPSSPIVTSSEETKARIKDILRSHPGLIIDERQGSDTPQALALEWLLSTDTSSLLQNGDLSENVILERYGLAVLFYSTSGPLWKNQYDFLTGSSFCRWNDGSQVPALDGFSLFFPPNGVFCDEDAHVQHIWLSENGLRGPIPSELGLLSNLQRLYMHGNTLENKAPSELGRLTLLKGLGLAYNALTGTMPTEFGYLTALGDLQVQGNALQGTLPTELGRLAALESFSASSNQLTGRIPTEIGRLTTLRDVQVQNNTLHGTLPTELGNLASMEYLDLFENQFTGTLPTEIGRLSHLVRFLVHENVLQGSLPTELGQLTTMVYLDVTSNHFTGTLPKELGQLTALNEVNVEDNYLTGTIPEELERSGPCTSVTQRSAQEGGTEKEG